MGFGASVERVCDQQPSLPTQKPVATTRALSNQGGNDAAIVRADCDVDRVAPALFSKAFEHTGQVCCAIKRVFVHESIADAFVAKLVQRVAALRVGLPWDEKVAITPLPEKGKATQDF